MNQTDLISWLEELETKLKSMTSKDWYEFEIRHITKRNKGIKRELKLIIFKLKWLWKQRKLNC